MTAPVVEEPAAAEPSSQELVLRFQAGDRDRAFTEIYRRYIDMVFRFIYFRVGSRPLAEDLASETFTRAFLRLNKFTWIGTDLGAWLVTIARNLTADHFKSGRYRLELLTGDVLDADSRDESAEANPEHSAVAHLRNVELLTALKQLRPDQRECLKLRFLNGLSVTETADEMGKNVGAIKALQYRAVRALARHVDLDGLR